jgi:hypothetical protein
LRSLERLGWVGHQWALVRAGRASIGTLLALLKALEGERDPDVLQSIHRVAADLARRLAPDTGDDVALALADQLAAGHRPGLDRVGLDGTRREPLERSRRRAQLMSLVGELGRERTLIEACADRVDAYFEQGHPLPRATSEVMLRIAATAGRPGLANRLTRGARNANSPQERRAMLFALGALPGPAGPHRALRATLDTRLAPAVDRAGLLIGMLRTRETAVPAWEHLQHHWARFQSEMPPILLARIASESSMALPLERLGEIRPFFTRHPLEAGPRTLRQISEQITIDRRLQRRAGRALRRLLIPQGD